MVLLTSLPDEKRPVRRDIFDYPQECEAALADDDRLLAIYHYRADGQSLYRIAKLLNERNRMQVWRDWQYALRLIVDALIAEIGPETLYETEEVTISQGKLPVYVMRKNSRHRWKEVWCAGVAQTIFALDERKT